MALIKCSNCGEQISDKAKKCIHCDQPILIQEKKDITSEDANLIKKNKELEEKLEIQRNINNEQDKIHEQEKNQYEKELSSLKKENEKLQNKIKNKETFNKAVNTSKKGLLLIIKIIRYCIFAFFLLGSIVCLFDGFYIKLFSIYLLLSLSFAPFIYELIFKKIKLNNKSKIITQIIVPIIVFIIVMMIN